MKRRLNIAAALVHDPDVLIFDEPTVGVDPQSRNAIFDNLEQLRDRGKALLYTTHYMEEAERLCDRVVIMDHGEVVASDTLQGLYKRLPAVDTLELEVDGTSTSLRSAREPGIARPSQDGTRLHAGVADLGHAAPALLAWLAAHGHAVHRISSGRRRPRGRLPLAHRSPAQGLRDRTMNLTAFRALVRKDLILYFSNRRALIMSIAAPIVIAAFFGAIFGSSPGDKPTRIPIAFVDRDASALSQAIAASIKADPAFEVTAGDEAAMIELARQGKVRAAIVLPSASAPRHHAR